MCSFSLMCQISWRPERDSGTTCRTTVNKNKLFTKFTDVAQFDDVYVTLKYAIIQENGLFLNEFIVKTNEYFFSNINFVITVFYIYILLTKSKRGERSEAKITSNTKHIFYSKLNTIRNLHGHV